MASEAHQPSTPKIDPRALKPSEMCRLLNSTPLGEVINERQLHRHRTRAGFRIASAGGDGKTIDLLRYAAWLVATRHDEIARRERARSASDELTGYDAHRERARERNKALSLSGRNIGELPPVGDPGRKSRGAASFRGFCDTYIPRSFHLPWSDDQLKVIAKLETAVLDGGLFAMAMPRGSGKTTLCETACLWAILIGARPFVCLIGSDEEHAASMLESIKSELEHNDLLLDDYPEVCYPIRSLEGIHQRASGQLYKGEPTHIGWTAREITLPTIAPDGRPSAASGSIIAVAGITGRIRGMKRKRADGQSLRPSLVLVDDPQTDESARSPSQCRHRAGILAGAVLGLAGPTEKIAGLMTLTVVRRGDMADTILDSALHPEWQGERTAMLRAMPTNAALWDQYARVLADAHRSSQGIADATAFYLANREAMDAGAEVAWPARYNHDEASAIQHAMNLLLRDARAFYAEYQNQPLDESPPEAEMLTTETILTRLSGEPRGVVPAHCARLTAFIDVQGKALYWMVCAWSDGFAGSVIDYGTEPDQKGGPTGLRALTRTLQDAAPGSGREGAIYAGLERIAGALLTRDWQRPDGATLRIERCLIDANWGESTDVVYNFCRQSAHRGALTPSHGRYIGASSIPMSMYTLRPGERAGLNWRIPLVGRRRVVRHALYDTNFWKSFVHARLAVLPADTGSLTLFGGGARWRPDRHSDLAAHLTSERPVRTEGRGRVVDEWKILPGGPDNHWLDCLAGCAVGASIQGVRLAETTRPQSRGSAGTPKRERKVWTAGRVHTPGRG